MRQHREPALNDRVADEIMPCGLPRKRFLPIHAVIAPHLALHDTHRLPISPNPHRIRHSGFLEVLSGLRIGHSLSKHARRLYDVSQGFLACLHLSLRSLDLKRVLRHDQRVPAPPASAVVQHTTVVRLRYKRGVCPPIVQQTSDAMHPRLAIRGDMLYDAAHVNLP